MLTTQPCPVCGAYSLTMDEHVSRLVAVCDVLVIKALETMGKRILRADRSRFMEWGDRPVYLAYTCWQVDDETVSKGLKGAWDVVPAMLNVHGEGCDVTAVQVTAMLDSYLHDLAITGMEHTLEQLYYRFETRLSLPVFLKEPCDAAS